MTTFLEAMDNRTLLVATSFVAGAFAPLMLFIRRSHRTYPGFSQWAAALCCISVSAFFHSLRGFTSVFFQAVLGNSFLFVGLFLYTMGVRLFCGLSWRWRWYYLVLGAAIAGICWFCFVQPAETHSNC